MRARAKTMNAYYVPHTCAARGCSRCVDEASGWGERTTARIVETLQGDAARIFEAGRGMMNGQDLKVVSFIISLQPDDAISSVAELNESRQVCERIAKRYAGPESGRLMWHPYRGGHGRGKEKRDSLDRSHQSGHAHGAMLSYWTERNNIEWTRNFLQNLDPKKYPILSEKFANHTGEIYLNWNILGRLGHGAKADSIVWAKVSEHVSYELDHAGYIGRGAAVVRFGVQGGQKPMPPKVRKVKIDPDDGGDMTDRIPADIIAHYGAHPEQMWQGTHERSSTSAEGERTGVGGYRWYAGGDLEERIHDEKYMRWLERFKAIRLTGGCLSRGNGRWGGD